MVARINTNRSIAKTFNYNEQKVQQGKAEILAESGFLKDVQRLNFHDKINHFERYTSLRDSAKTNTLHVSLNFDPSEKLSNEKMIDIAAAYMEKIGFGQQPYLVYRHYDSGHPHLHVVSVNIKRDGDRISMHNLGRNQSEKARKEIEIEFGLVKAEDKKNADPMKLQPVNAKKVTYGKAETRRAIANVLGPVINQYKFTSLAELNAILGLYNINADRGQEGSRIYRNNGLTYRILDEQGNKVGVPQRASSFFMKPTLAKLEGKFLENESLRLPYKKRLQTAIAWVLSKYPANIESFVKALEKENISVVLRKGKENVIYGITYVDHKTKCVFNGSDLGKQYSAKAVLENCREQVIQTAMAKDSKQSIQRQLQVPQQGTKAATQYPAIQGWQLPKGKPIHTPAADYVPYQLKRKKKRKKKRISI
ncbi:MAG TPA: relaxase/mobilization nuclease domain-containing protein [Ginsengibacter sp.]|nr:relaxase/mobilization nuclease domain-containing protein [Ginsengibacter sp.]HUN02292.1 relaxase/mobilization nuclease domain-containing protein [Niabella sp.]